MTHLEMDRVRLAYRRVTEDGAEAEVLALDEVSLAVAPGELVALVGPSGCGKSSLLLLINGLLAPTAGQVRLDGRVIDAPSADRALVFQEAALLPWRTVQANVELGLELRGLPAATRREVARRHLHLVGLETFEQFFPHQLSGGMRQRVGLARALAAFPIAINTHAGVRSTDPALLRAVRAFGGRRRDEVLKVVLPASVPLVLAGLRIGAGRALVGIVVGEMFGANAGLGFRLAFYGSRLRAADVLVQVLGIVLIGLAATQAVRLAERRFGLGRGA